tara:strand:- start:2550 stop:2753 length:204 start_codon:yes stop_codon:yes gene_type:complete
LTFVLDVETKHFFLVLNDKSNFNVIKMITNMAIILIKHKLIETMKNGENRRLPKTTNYLVVVAFIEI